MAPSRTGYHLIPNGDDPDTEVPQRSSALERIWVASQSFVRGNVGLLLVAASQAFFSMMNVFVKVLNSIDPPVPALELINVRMSITYLCCIAYTLCAKIPDPFLGPKEVRGLLFLRGFTGFISLFGVVYPLQYLSLSDTTVLTFLAPMCTAVAGAIFLKEKLKREYILAGVVSLAGVILIARPAAIFGGAPPTHHGPRVVTPAQRVTAVGVALIGVLGATGAFTSIRAIGQRAHPVHVLAWHSLSSVVFSTIWMVLKRETIIVPEKLEWMGCFVLIGFFGFFAQILLTMGLRRETAGRGSLAMYSQIVFATCFELLFFNALPTFLSVIGTVFIIGSAIYVALSKDAPTQVVSDSEEGGTSTVRLLQESDDDIPSERAAENRLYVKEVEQARHHAEEDLSHPPPGPRLH